MRIATAGLGSALAFASGLCGFAPPAAAAIVFGGTSLVVNSPGAIGGEPLSFLPTGLGATGTVVFTDAMTLPNAIVIQSGAVANFHTQIFDDVLSGPNSGAGALIKQSPGRLTLTGINSYSGGTTVSAGTLAINNAAALGAGTLHLLGAGLLGTADAALSNAFTLSGATRLAAARGTTLATGESVRFEPGASVTIGEAGADGTVLWRAGALSDAALIDVTAGTLRVGLGTHRGNLPTVAVQANARVDLGDHDIALTLGGGAGRITTTLADAALRLNGGTFEGSIDGDLSLNAVAGSTTLSGRNAPGRGTRIAADAELVIAGDGLIDGSIRNDGVLTIRKADAVVLEQTITGSGELRKQGRGRLTLSAGNTYSGGTQLQAGTLALARGDALGSGDLTIGNALLLNLADARLANNLRVAGDATIATAHGTTLTGTGIAFSSGLGAVLHFGSPGADGHIIWDVGRLGRDLRVDGGTLTAFTTHSEQVLSIASTAVAEGAVLELAARRADVGRLTGAGDITATLPNLVLPLFSADFSGRITGSMGLEIFGAASTAFQGDVVLSGQNDYTGGTLVTGVGKLMLATGGALNGDLTVYGQVAQEAGTRLGLNDLTLDSEHALGPHAILTQSGGGTQVLGAFKLGGVGRGDYALNGGTLALHAAQLVVGNFRNQFHWQAGTLRFLDDYRLSGTDRLLSDTLTLDSSQVLRARSLKLAAEVSVTLNGAMLMADETLRNGGVIRGVGTLDATVLENSGQLELAAGDSLMHAHVKNLPTGEIHLAKRARLTLDGDFDNEGVLTVATEATARFKGRVGGSGAFRGDGEFIYEGAFHPGLGPSQLALQGRQVFEHGAVLELELELAGAHGPGDCASCYTQFVFDGPVTFHNAGLALNLVANYVPRGGEVFTLFVFNAAHSGAVGAISLPVLDKALRWDTSALMSLGQVRVAAVPLPGALWLCSSALAVLARRRQISVRRRTGAHRSGW